MSNSVLYEPWRQVASSADGNKLAVIIDGGAIWTLQTTPSPQLKISSASGALDFSWIVPSTNFVLQESSALNGDWVTLTNLPALNLSTLQEELTLPPANGSGFFRLVAQ